MAVGNLGGGAGVAIVPIGDVRVLTACIFATRISTHHLAVRRRYFARRGRYSPHDIMRVCVFPSALLVYAVPIKLV